MRNGSQDNYDDTTPLSVSILLVRRSLQRVARTPKDAVLWEKGLLASIVSIQITLSLNVSTNLCVDIALSHVI